MDDTRSTPDRAAIRIFPPALPLLTIGTGVVLETSVAPLSMTLPTVVRWLGGALVIAAVVVFGGWSVYLMRKSGQSENPWKPTTSIVRAGPYRITRNPMYLQMVMVCIGVGVALNNGWILLLTPLCAAALQFFVIRHEEAYLERKFGSEYRAYMSSVRRWI